jgi:predicted signal transduction protein with EAL and GGDEF domain
VATTDFIARIGGDEFAVVQTKSAGPSSAASSHPASSSWSAGLTTSMAGTSSSAASIGIAIAPADGANPDLLLKNADMALYSPRATVRGTHRFFEREMDKRLQSRRALELDLRKAHRQRRVRGLLPADPLPADRQGLRLRGADALEPP